jgi:hypothetical protein
MIAIGRSYSIFVCSHFIVLGSKISNYFVAERLVQKLDKARDDVVKTGTAYRDLSRCLDSAWITEWTDAEEKANRERGKALAIYDVVIDKGEYWRSFICIWMLIDCHPAPTLGDVRLRLMEDEGRHRDLSGMVATLTDGLAIERSQ